MVRRIVLIGMILLVVLSGCVDAGTLDGETQSHMSDGVIIESGDYYHQSFWINESGSNDEWVCYYASGNNSFETIFFKNQSNFGDYQKALDNEDNDVVHVRSGSSQLEENSSEKPFREWVKSQFWRSHGYGEYHLVIDYTNFSTSPVRENVSNEPLELSFDLYVNSTSKGNCIPGIERETWGF